MPYIFVVAIYFSGRYIFWSLYFLIWRGRDVGQGRAAAGPDGIFPNKSSCVPRGPPRPPPRRPRPRPRPVLTTAELQGYKKRPTTGTA